MSDARTDYLEALGKVVHDTASPLWRTYTTGPDDVGADLEPVPWEDVSDDLRRDEIELAQAVAARVVRDILAEVETLYAIATIDRDPAALRFFLAKWASKRGIAQELP